MQTIGRYLKKHTEALVKDVGIENACAITGKSKATLGRYYSDNPEHHDRYMPIDAVAALEKTASFPHVSTALAELLVRLYHEIVAKRGPVIMVLGV